MSTLTPPELEAMFHSLMDSPSQWQAVRYEVDINYQTGVPESLVIAFRSNGGVLKRLRFNEPQFDGFGPLQMPAATNLYVADLSSLGWSADQHIEVGEWEEDRSRMFWARSVEEIS